MSIILSLVTVVIVFIAIVLYLGIGAWIAEIWKGWADPKMTSVKYYSVVFGWPVYMVRLMYWVATQAILDHEKKKK